MSFGALSKYAGRRLAIMVLQLIAMTVAVFVLIRLLPTDPAAQRVGIIASPEALTQARQALGLDQSVLAQLWEFLKGLGQFDLGISWQSNDGVLGEIGTRIPVTLQLITLSFLIAVLIAIPVALLRAFKPGGKVDRGVFVYGLFAGAQPEFWWGIMFIFVFSYELGIFPQPVGLLDRGIAPVDPITHFILIDSLIQLRFDAFWSALWHFMLPCLTLAFVVVGPIIKTASEALAAVLRSDFVLQARARGLATRRVAAYALRNALAPVVTLTGILYGYMLGGAVLIEQIFSLNGIGQYALQRTLALDFPSIQGVVLVMTAFSLLAYLVVDILYAVIDPRIRL